MIQLPKINPPQFVLDGLSEYQSKIIGSFLERRALAKSDKIPGFKSRNKVGNIVFEEVKNTLTKMCSGSKRCAYCEDSAANQVEHIYPKDFFPDKCFDWNNYLYSCDYCNKHKSNKFAVFIEDEVNHLTGDLELDGDPLLVNPRIENGMNFFKLNLLTFKFECLEPNNSKIYIRANYTFEEVLKLNKEYLISSRETAYGNYKCRLGFYNDRKMNLSSNLNLMIEQLQKESHPTVWKEIQRSYNDGSLATLDPEFYELFNLIPEALNW